MRLREHRHVICTAASEGQRIRLRPLTEGDWNLLERWNTDPEVLYYAEGDHVTARSPQQVRQIFCTVSQTALCFIIEVDDQPVGECWLQDMNLDRVLHTYPDADCRRIDLTIGDRKYWDRGVGTAVVRTLTDFAFESQGADVIYIPDIADFNVRSRRVFEKTGYSVVACRERSARSKAQVTYDMALTRARYLSRRQGH